MSHRPRSVAKEIFRWNLEAFAARALCHRKIVKACLLLKRLHKVRQLVSQNMYFCALVKISINVARTQSSAWLIIHWVVVLSFLHVPLFWLHVPKLRCLCKQDLGRWQSMVVIYGLLWWTKIHTFMWTLYAGSDHEILRSLIEVESVLGACQVFVYLG